MIFGRTRRNRVLPKGAKLRQQRSNLTGSGHDFIDDQKLAESQSYKAHDVANRERILPSEGLPPHRYPLMASAAAMVGDTFHAALQRADTDGTDA